MTPRALTIATSDSGGGAGIQADLKAFAAAGVHGMSALVALTAQNTVGVLAVHELPPEFVRAQLEAVVDDIGVDAAKTGMLFSTAVIETVADFLAEHPVQLVVDPVLIASSGAQLFQDDAVETLVGRLFPLATVVTPNLPEAESLAGIPVASRPDMEEAARRIHRLGPRYVLVKGGHLKGDAIDLLWNGKVFTAFRAPRIDSGNTHGTGCTLSAAIAAGLARGQAIGDAIRDAKAYVTRAIREGFAAGRGVGQLRHFIAEW